MFFLLPTVAQLYDRIQQGARRAWVVDKVAWTAAWEGPRSAREGSTVKRCFHQDQFYCLGTGAAISKGLQSDQQLGNPATQKSLWAGTAVRHMDGVTTAATPRWFCRGCRLGWWMKPLSMVVIHLNQAPLAPAPSPGVL